VGWWLGWATWREWLCDWGSVSAGSGCVGRRRLSGDSASGFNGAVSLPTRNVWPVRYRQRLVLCFNGAVSLPTRNVSVVVFHAFEDPDASKGPCRCRHGMSTAPHNVRYAAPLHWGRVVAVTE